MPASTKESTMEPDEIDRRILRVLQKQGRMSNAELSEQVNLSPSACHRRVQRPEPQRTKRCQCNKRDTGST